MHLCLNLKVLQSNATHLNTITIVCASESHPILNYTLWLMRDLANRRTFLLVCMDIT